MDPVGMKAREIGQAIAAGQIDPVEVTEAFLAAIAAHPHAARIYARVTPDRARAEALAARDRARAGLRRGPLDGVPLSWKDLFDTAGIATEAGTALLAGRVPERDAAVVAAATEAGTICLGKTHMSEIAFSGLGLNPVTATPPNVNDPAALPGGSSSGAAASVAFGLAPAAVDTDTGASIRLPAAWNDLVGFKPTHGTHPMEGVLPLCPSFDTAGPLARDVADAALVNAALGNRPPPDLAGARLSGIRIAVVDDLVMDDLDDAPARAFADALGRIAAAGAMVQRVAFPGMVRAMELSLPLYAAEAHAAWRDVVETAPHLMFARILERVRGGASVLATDYLAGWQELRRLRAQYAETLAGFDAVACPTSPILPPDAQRALDDADFYRAVNLRTQRNTRMGNLMGLAGISLPAGVPSCGILLQALPGRDGALLRLAAAAEAALA